MEKTKNTSTFILIGIIVLALLFALILPGAVLDDDAGHREAGLYGFAFGNIPLKSVFIEYMFGEEMTIRGAYLGSFSIFAIISLSLMVIALIALVLAFITKNQIFNYIACVLMILAGITMLLLLTEGTNIKASVLEGVKVKQNLSFKKVFENYKLGAGAILYSLFTICGGALGIYNYYKKII